MAKGPAGNRMGSAIWEGLRVLAGVSQDGEALSKLADRDRADFVLLRHGASDGVSDEEIATLAHYLSTLRMETKRP